jgi:hypothetical protein
MSRPGTERPMRNSYELVGRPVEPFMTELDHTAATNLRDYIAQDYFPTLMAVRPDRKMVPHLSDQHDVVLASSGFGRQHYSTPDLDIGSNLSLRLEHCQDESWKLRAWHARYVHNGTENKIAVWYFLDVIGGQVLQAKRQVRIIRTNSDAAFARLLEEGPLRPIRTDRKAYELPLTENDCLQLQDRLGRVAKRCVALAS